VFFLFILFFFLILLVCPSIFCCRADLSLQFFFLWKIRSFSSLYKKNKKKQAGQDVKTGHVLAGVFLGFKNIRA